MVQATERLMATRLPGPKPYYVTGESPQLWFEPGEVWEIRGADLTLSPVHKVRRLCRAAPQRWLPTRPSCAPRTISAPVLQFDGATAVTFLS